MAKKNLGKVKRYNHSFYTGHHKTKRAAGIGVMLAVLFVLGWLAGPAVVDFGTRTWYEMKKAAQSRAQAAQTPSGPESGPEEPSIPESSSQLSETPQETPAPTKEPVQNTGEGGWAFVTVTAAKDAQQAAQTAEQLAEQGVKYAVLPFKDGQGHVYYASQVEAAQPAISSTTFDPAAAAQELRKKGITPVASISVFRDPAAALADREMAVRYQNSEYLWLDAARDQGGKPWLNPASAKAVQYNVDLIAEAKSLGYDQVWLAGLQFPPAAGRQKANFGDTGERSMSQILADDLALFSQQADCWVELPLSEAAKGEESPLLGAAPAALGIQRLVLHTDEAPDPEQLTAVVQAAKDGGVSIVALLEGNEFQLQ